MSRIIIELTSIEMSALKQQSRQELRHPRDQAHMILRNALLGDQPTLTSDKPATDLVSQAETVNGFVNGQPT